MRNLVWLILLMPTVQGCSLILENFDEADWGDGIYTSFRGQPVVIAPETMEMVDRDFVTFERMDVSTNIIRSGQDGLGADCSGVPYVELLDSELNLIKKWVNHSAPITAGEHYGFRAGADYVVVSNSGQELRRETIPIGFDDWRVSAALFGDEVLLLNGDGDFVWLADGVKAKINGSDYGALKGKMPALAVNPMGQVALLQAAGDANRLWIMEDGALTRVIELPGATGWDVEMEWFDGWLIRSHGVALHVSDTVKKAPPNMVSAVAFPSIPEQQDPGRVKSAATNGERAAIFLQRDSGQDEMYLFGPGFIEEGVWKYELDIIAQNTNGEGTWVYRELGPGDASAEVSATWTTLDGEPFFSPDGKQEMPSWSPLFVFVVIATAWTTRKLSHIRS